jgi:hypothetical protein
MAPEGRASAESGAPPAPRREPRPARVVVVTLPRGEPQAHATKVESANRFLAVESSPSATGQRKIEAGAGILHGFSTERAGKVARPWSLERSERPPLP